MVKEAAEKMREITAKDAKQYIRENYPSDNVNELTINAQVIACSVNHPSAHHYTSSRRFLFYLGNGRYRLHDPERDGFWDITKQGAEKRNLNLRTTKGSFFSQIKAGGQIFLPKAIQEKLSLEQYDFVAFVEDSAGNILLRKAELRIVE
jgi:hypothetical protein